MNTRFLVILFTILFYLTGHILAHDQSKLTELGLELQKLMIQMGNSQNETESELIQKKIDLLTAELIKEGQQLEKEIQPQLQAFENSLPPILKKIYKLDNEIITLEEDLIANAEKINAASKEILRLMGELYLNESKIATDLKSFIVSLKFCKEVTINFETKGRGSEPELFEVSYDIKTPLTAYWTSDYLVDVIQRKGYLLAHSIETVESEKQSEKIEVISLSGWKQVIRIGKPPTTGPIDKHKYESGSGSITIGPTENKQFDFSNPNSWPDEVVSSYVLGYTPPFLTFFSSQDEIEGMVVPIPCATNLNNLTYITPDELNKGIREGTYTKVITKDTFSPICDESTITISIDFPNLLCDQHADKGALATADACIDHGGYILATEDHVFAHGKPVARVGDHVLCLRHGITEIVGDKDVKVFSDEQRIARVGDKTKCGAIIMGGSFNVYAGER